MLFQSLDMRHPAREELTFRDLSMSDVARIAELAGDWDVARMTSRIPYPYTEAAAAQWVDDLSPGEIVRAVVVGDELIGVCGLVPYQDDKTAAEIGYWLGKPYWGRGYATIAVRGVVNDATKKLGFSRLTASHAIDNPASGRVLEKLGFKRTGECRCWCEARRDELDALRYEFEKPKFWWRK